VAKSRGDRQGDVVELAEIILLDQLLQSPPGRVEAQFVVDQRELSRP
jgi:hypothetical protein